MHVDVVQELSFVKPTKYKRFVSGQIMFTSETIQICTNTSDNKSAKVVD